MASSLFVGANHASLYSKFRPNPPSKLVSEILNFLSEKIKGPYEAAIDVGCGSGQSTGCLSPYFNCVTGVDVSEAQLKEGIKNNKEKNVNFKYGTAEALPFSNKSVQLVTAGQSAHWFNLPAFYKEVDRVLVPNGVLAMYCYNFPELTWKDKGDKLTEVLYKVYKETYEFWSYERAFVDKSYTHEVFTLPFSDTIRVDDLFHDCPSTLGDVAGYVESWSGFQKYKEVKGDESASLLIKSFTDGVLEVIGEGSADTELVTRFNFYLLLGRKY